MPSSKSASAKPVGSCTPFSLEHASQRFTFCILPSRICVRKTVASLHLQTSHNISLNWTLLFWKHSTPTFPRRFCVRTGFAQFFQRKLVYRFLASPDEIAR